jgi:colanic acid/amylovoran biosynthesis glycosyltransferase
MPSSLHLLDSYLPRTETFIWQSLRKLRRFPPLVLADRLENLDAFPLPRGTLLEAHASRSLWARVGARLSGSFAPVRYTGGLEAVRSHDPAVCHVHKGYRALVTREFTRTLDLPLVVNFYGSDVSQKPFLRRAAQGYREVFAQARFLLVEGPAMQERLIELGAPAKKIRVQPIAIDPADYPLRERFWDGNRPIHILFVGRLVAKKGLETGLRALSDARVDFPWRLTVIGDGPLAPRMRALAQRLGIGAQVDFVGSRSLSETRAAMQAHDLLLQPSRIAPDGDSEGGAPTVILEAQACGMPVISTTHADIPYITLPGQSAWLAPEGDVAALAYLLRRASEEADRWGIMGRAGRFKIETDHDVNRTIVKLEDLYAEAMGT